MVSIEAIIYLVGVGVLAVGALVAAGYGELGLEDTNGVVIFFVAPLAILFWPLTLALLLIIAIGYLPYRGGRAIAAAADRRQLRQDIEKRERIAALHDLRGQYPRDSLTWQILDDQIKNQ